VLELLVIEKEQQLLLCRQSGKVVSLICLSSCVGTEVVTDLNRDATANTLDLGCWQLYYAAVPSFVSSIRHATSCVFRNPARSGVRGSATVGSLE
jgi:hypothetical protein